MGSKRYSRQQAIRLSGSSSSRLSYLDRIGLVVPEKIGDGKKPVVLYAEWQIEQIKLLDRAAKFLSLEGIRLAIKKGCLPEVVSALTELLG